jgi:Tfp pilus assembly protein PilW
MSAPKIPRNAAGFGLVEVMISIAISLIVILAVTGLYLTQRSAYTTQGALSLVQENARYLMRSMTHDLRLSGYRDINASTTFPTNAPGSKLFIDAQNDVGPSVNDVLILQFYGASDTSV